MVVGRRDQHTKYISDLFLNHKLIQTCAHISVVTQKRVLRGTSTTFCLSTLCSQFTSVRLITLDCGSRILEFQFVRQLLKQLSQIQCLLNLRLSHLHPSVVYSSVGSDMSSISVWFSHLHPFVFNSRPWLAQAVSTASRKRCRESADTQTKTVVSYSKSDKGLCRINPRPSGRRFSTATRINTIINITKMA